MPNFYQFIEPISYTVTYKDGTTEFFGGQTCFSKITKSFPSGHEKIQSVTLFPPAVFDVCYGMSLEIGDYLLGGRRYLWEPILNHLIGKKLFSVEKNHVVGITVTFPEDCSLGYFKFLLFLMRAPFVCPVLYWHMWENSEEYAAILQESVERLWRKFRFLSSIRPYIQWKLPVDTSHNGIFLIGSMYDSSLKPRVYKPNKFLTVLQNLNALGSVEVALDTNTILSFSFKDIEIPPTPPPLVIWSNLLKQKFMEFESACD